MMQAAFESGLFKRGQFGRHDEFVHIQHFPVQCIVYHERGQRQYRREHGQRLFLERVDGRFVGNYFSRRKRIRQRHCIVPGCREYGGIPYSIVQRGRKDIHNITERDINRYVGVYVLYHYGIGRNRRICFTEWP